MMRPKLKLTLLAVLALAGCSQILGIDDYDIDKKLDGAAGDEGNHGGQGNEGGSNGGSTSQAGAPDNQAGAPSTGGTPNGGTGGTSGAGAGGVDAGGAGGDGGEPPLGELIPCDSEDCCDAADGVAVGAELLSDGGFEDGLVSDGESPWTQDANDSEGITNDLELGWTPKSGDYYAYLSGRPDERTTLYSEDVEIPADAGWLVVSGYRWFQIDAKDETNEDFALIAFYSYANENPEELPFYWTKASASTDGWGDTPSWSRFSYSWDAASHQGGVRYLGLRGESDLYPTEDDASSYLFDDVSLKVFRCYESR